MLTIEKLLDNIKFPKDYYNKILDVNYHYDFNIVKPLFDKYIKGEYDLLNEIRILLPDDISSEVWLCMYLNEVLITYNTYKEMKIDDYIFYATMSFFTRSILENYKIYDKYIFNREHWTYRHINMKIFRLGLLEYEFRKAPRTIIINDKEVIKEGQDIICVHIPSDVIFDYDKVIDTFKQLKEFVLKYFPQYIECQIYCSTWLLSPALEEMISKQSKIAIFRSFFNVLDLEYDDSYKRWLFGNQTLDPIDFPEKTSLQRSVKKFVLSGGEVPNGCGILKFDFINK